MKLALALALGLSAGTATAGPVEIVDVVARQSGGTWTFNVTVTHADTGWDHYADGWQVVDADGAELGMRVLAHPHVNEQPFTRSLSGVVIPEGTTEVYIRARDNLDGWTDGQFTVPLN